MIKIHWGEFITTLVLMLIGVFAARYFGYDGWTLVEGFILGNFAAGLFGGGPVRSVEVETDHQPARSLN